MAAALAARKTGGLVRKIDIKDLQNALVEYGLPAENASSPTATHFR